MDLQSQIYALIFSTESPVSFEEIKAFLTKYNGIEYQDEEILNIIGSVIASLDSSSLPFSIVQIGGGYVFKSKPEYHSMIASFLNRESVKKLTKVALETLAVIAYKQPVEKSEIEAIRGVNSDYTVQKLMERDLVEIKGRAETIGKPLLYGTTQYFLNYFGINDLSELPKLKEFTETENQIGEKEDIIQQG
ncbi:MAG: SMC-Scp complex subunit ScpB [Chitinophagales bacterium]|nr:SMC-Scp complex subunit ScpB [Chitinophagales bacterium]